MASGSCELEGKSNKVLENVDLAFIALTHYAIKIIFLRLKITHVCVSVGLFGIQTLSKCFSERANVSPLISSEVRVDYQ